MANRDEPRGFSACGPILRARKYVASAAIARGDAVKQEAAGRVAPADTGGNIHVGAICGVAQESAAAAGDSILVLDHPDQEFVVQSDSADVDAQTDLGLNYSIVATDPSGGESRQELDGDSGATTATLPLKALRLDPKVGNALGANTDLIVVINNHQLKGGTGTLGV